MWEEQQRQEIISERRADGWSPAEMQAEDDPEDFCIEAWTEEIDQRARTLKGPGHRWPRWFPGTKRQQRVRIEPSHWEAGNLPSLRIVSEGTKERTRRARSVNDL